MVLGNSGTAGVAEARWPRPSSLLETDWYGRATCAVAARISSGRRAATSGRRDGTPLSSSMSMRVHGIVVTS